MDAFTPPECELRALPNRAAVLVEVVVHGMRGLTSVVRTPKRAYTCASSVPDGPAPRMAMLPGRSRRLVPSRLVQNPASASPSSFGTFGTEPTATTMSRVSSSCVRVVVATETRPGAVIIAVPRIGTIPAFS